MEALVCLSRYQGTYNTWKEIKYMITIVTTIVYIFFQTFFLELSQAEQKADHRRISL